MKALNDNIRPKNYKLHFDLLDGEEFNGEAEITLECAKECNELKLNGKNLKITHAELNQEKITDISYQPDLILIKCNLPAGKQVLRLKFSGRYGKVTGLYKSHYQDKFIYTTQFEAAHARECFPCVDEPEAKATFDLSITVNEGFMGISNTKIIEEKTSEGQTTFTFATSPKMSTYLLYIGAGELEYIEEEHNKVRVRIITVPGKAEKMGQFAMEASKKFLTYFEEYFAIKYPLDKLDMIAVPDFSSGAMENWGAITYREDALLYDSEVSSLAAKQRIAEIISHELVHQWFGNLVTMKWWNDLWLNESFADYMAYKAVAHHYPEMDPWAEFLTSRVGSAFFLDALDSSHPINVKVNSPVEIREVFDAISYSKGGMVLRMLENYIGEDVFKQGLQSYLEKYSYDNAEGNDLWEEIGKVTDKPVQEMMDNWLDQMGFPLIEVCKSENGFKLLQKRFQFIDKNDDKKWIVPISTSEGYVLLKDKEESVELKNAKINLGQKGFYRVKYDHATLSEIKKEFSSLEAIDQWGLFSDLFALLLGTKIPLAEFIEMVEAYQGEEYIVVDDLLGNFSKLSLIKKIEKVDVVAEKFCSRLLERFGWEKKEGEKETTGMLRSAIIHKLGRLENQEVLAKIKTLFVLFKENPKSVHPDLRSAMYKLVAWQGDEGTFQELQELYRNSKNPQEQLQLLASLGCFKDEELLKKALAFALTSEVRHQNIVTLVANVCVNPYGRDLVWPWITDNWQQIKEIFSHYVWHFNAILKYLSFLGDRKIGENIESFLQASPIPGTQRALAQMLEKIEVYENFKNNAQI